MKFKISVFILFFLFTIAHADTCATKSFCEGVIAKIESFKKQKIPDHSSGHGNKYVSQSLYNDEDLKLDARQKSCFVPSGSVYVINCSNKREDIDNKLGAHLCGGPMTPSDEELKRNDVNYTVEGNFSYDPISTAPYVVPSLTNDMKPELKQTNIHQESSAIVNLINTGKNGSVQGQNTTFAGPDLDNNHSNNSHIATNQIRNSIVKLHGFYNPANNKNLFGNIHKREGERELMNGHTYNNDGSQRKALYSTRQCALYYYKWRNEYEESNDKTWVDKVSATELCGRVSLPDFDEAVGLNASLAKNVIADLSSTFLNLILMTIYGPPSDARIFMSHATIQKLAQNEHINQWPLISFLKDQCSKPKADYLADNEAKFTSGGYTNYETAAKNNGTKDCVIKASDIATASNFDKVFPTWKGHKTVSESFMSGYTALLNDCLSKRKGKLNTGNTNSKSRATSN